MKKELYHKENGVIRYYPEGVPNGESKAPKEPKAPKDGK